MALELRLKLPITTTRAESSSPAARLSLAYLSPGSLHTPAAAKLDGHPCLRGLGDVLTLGLIAQPIPQSDRFSRCR